MANLAGWPYWKVISITGQAGSGTDYQVELEIGDSAGGDFHLEGHCTNFPQDIIITDDDGTTLLDYWIEDITADPIVVHVEVKDDLGSNRDIRVYYGKSGETTDSDFEVTFNRADGFDSYPDGNLTGNDNWTTESGEQSWKVSTGSKKHGTKGANTLAGTHPSDSYVSLKTYTATTERVFGWWMRSSDVTNQTIVYVGASATSHASLIMFDSDFIQAFDGNGAGGGSWVNVVAVSDNTWYHVEVILDHTNDEYDVIIDGTLYNNGGSHWGFRHVPTTSAWLKISRHLNVAALVYFDSWYNRKYVSPEPAFSSAGAEQTPGLVSVFIRHNPALTGGMV